MNNPTEKYQEATEDRKTELLLELQNHPAYKYLAGDLVDELLESLRSIVEDQTPTNLEEIVLREQNIGEIRGLKRLRFNISDEYYRLTHKDTDEIEAQNDPIGS